MKDCNNCKHKDCWEYADPCNSCTDVNDTREPTNWEAQTNADRIRRMTDEELANFVSLCCGWTCAECPVGRECNGDECFSTWLDWLKQEAKNG